MSIGVREREPKAKGFLAGAITKMLNMADQVPGLNENLQGAVFQSFEQIKELSDCRAADQRFAKLFVEIIFSLKTNANMIKMAFHLLKILVDGQGSAA